jgi:hypothetical protein
MRKIILGLIISTTLLSCKKDEATTINPSTKTRTQYLTQKPWHDSIVLSRPDTMSTWNTNNYGNTTPCAKDDNSIFKTNFTYSVDQGSLLCFPSDPFILETGTWGFTQNETHIDYNRFNNGAFAHTLDWKIEKLDDNIFIYTYFYHPSPNYYKKIMVH